jgi:signal transduction histidine kinase
MDENSSRHSNREANGLITATMAHDLQNLLSTIQGYAMLLRDAIPATDERHAYADEISRAIDSLATMLLPRARARSVPPHP